MTRISPAFPIVAGALTLTFLWVVAWYWPTAAEVAGIWWRSDTFAHGLIVQMDAVDAGDTETRVRYDWNADFPPIEAPVVR